MLFTRPLFLVPRWSFRAILALAAVSGGGGSAFPSLLAKPPQDDRAPAATTAPAPRVGGGTEHKLCVAVDIAGHRVGYVECAAERLQDAARAAQARAKGDPSLTVLNAGSHANAVGVASLTASSQRLGVDLRGATSLPQRPVVAPPTTPFPRQP